VRRFIVPFAAVGSGIVVIAAILAFTGSDPAATIRSFFLKPFSSRWYFGNMLDLAALLMIAGTGSALAMKGGTFNLGGEAQLYAPALVTAVLLAPAATGANVALANGVSSAAGSAATQAATAAALSPPALAALFAAAFFAAALTGALLGFIPGILKARFGTNELIVSFLLSAALVPVLDYLVAGPFRDRDGSLIATPSILKAFHLPSLLRPSTFNPDFFLAIALAIATAVFLRKTKAGYRFRVTGTAPEFARFAGFPATSVTTLSMTVSGLFHGLAGFFAITGTWFTCHQGITSGMGWSALAVALIARANPAAVIPAALLYAWLETASDAALLSSVSGFDTTSIVQAVIFLVISARFLPGIRRRHV
jgi:riboflavin transport system permease protein